MGEIDRITREVREGIRLAFAHIKPRSIKAKLKDVAHERS